LARFGAGASPEETVSYTDRWFFIKHRDHRDSGLIVTDPIFGRLSKAWIVSFSRRIETPEVSLRMKSGGIWRAF